MAISVAIQSDHLLRLKLVLKSQDEFSNEQAERAFLDTEIQSEDDIEVVMQYLMDFRPAIYQRLNHRSVSIS